MSTLRVASDSFAEMDELNAILVAAILIAGGTWFERRTICEVNARGHTFPVLTALGSTDRNVPAVGFFGGVHGLECIGTQLVLEYMRALLRRLEWDELLREQLRAIRLVFMPIVNPGGMASRTRSNPNGVDLMHNAPQNAEGRVPFLADGQRIGPWLPWYRGPSGAQLEAESEALLSVVQDELLLWPLSFALDCHSGFGWDDSIWFPYARTEREMAHLPEMFLLKTMFEESYPHHGYAFEPQSHQYLLHGDLWDCAYDRARAPNIFLPMTLKLGSWRLDPQEPDAAFLAPRHLQSDQGASHAARAAASSELLRFPHAPRSRCGAGCRAATSAIRSCGARGNTGSPPARPRRHERLDPAAWTLTRETRHWDAFESAMRAQGLVTAHERIVCIDLPGNGEEHARRAPLSVQAMMAFARSRAATFGIVRSPCRIVAMSLGAMVACAWAHALRRDRTSGADQHQHASLCARARTPARASVADAAAHCRCMARPGTMRAHDSSVDLSSALHGRRGYRVLVGVAARTRFERGQCVASVAGGGALSCA